MLDGFERYLEDAVVEEAVREAASDADSSGLHRGGHVEHVVRVAAFLERA
jgi:hypothetical protein